MASNKYYPGNKNIPGVIHKIINQIPECTNFYELFAGSAVVSQKIAVESMVPVNIYLNELNPEVKPQLTVPAAGIFQLNALDILQSEPIVSAAKDTFIFLDPPYLHCTRPNNTTIYKYEMDEMDHLHLILAVRDLKCNVMIIHPQNHLYDIGLTSFRKVQIKIRYNNKTSIENLYMNYPEPTKLQVNKYTGSDCWDRQRIKRKGDRLVNKISSLPGKEKQYILSRIQNELLNDCSRVNLIAV